MSQVNRVSTGVSKITTAQRNAMIVGWGVAEEGLFWFNVTTMQWEGWNGLAVAIIG